MPDQTTFLTVLLVLAVITVPFIVGSALARRWRMNDYGWQIGLILFALFAGGVIVTNGMVNRQMKLGIDLRGGAILVYEVEPPAETAESKAAGDGQQKVDIAKVVAAVARRVNPGGVKEVSVRPFGDNKIEIIIPEADQSEVDRIERQISRAGTLEFRILASRLDSRHDRVIEQALKTRGEYVRIDDRIVGRWVPVKRDDQEEKQIEGNPEHVTRRDAKNRVQVLVVIERSPPVTGAYLTKAISSFDDVGKPAVSFGFNATGARLFGRLTDENLPEQDGRLRRYLGIVLDGNLNNAPTIEQRISDQGIIHGNFTQQEVDDLVAVLRAGSLPATLSEEPISSLLIGPTLGADTIERGKWAMIASVLVTVTFMILYYRFAGIVASAAVLTNLLVTVAIMIAIKATFTLPGLAGLALTVGMAVDANVLIYERIREELARGAALRMAIRNGFGRAMSAIIDSHITTLITAVVLYVLGTDQVRGFAVTLFLGISMSLFTAVFCARVVFEVAERNHWIKKLKMMQAIKPTSFDFVSKYRGAFIGTCVLAALSIAVLVARGSNMLDIDFTSGSSVQLQFESKHPQDIAVVRKEAQEVLPPGLVVSGLAIAGQEEGVHFLLNTSDPDIDSVKKNLFRKFGDKLARNQMTIADVTEVDVKATPPADADQPQPGAETPAASDAPATTEPGQPAAQEPATQLEASPPSDQPATPKADELKPDEAKPADAPPSAPPATPPTPNQQSRRFDATDRLLAMAENDQLIALLGQEPIPPATPPSDQPSAEPSAAATQEPSAAATQEPSAAAATDEPTGPATEPSPPATTEPAADGAAEQPAAATDSTATSAAPTERATVAELTFKEPVDHDTLRDIFKKHYPDADVLLTNADYVEGSDAAYAKWQAQIPLPKGEAEKVFGLVAQDFANDPYFPSASKIGAAVAASTRQQAALAIFASMVLMVVYIWVRFQNVSFGLSAVVALAFDVIITLGAMAVSYYIAPYAGFMLIEPFKINLTIVAAFLTIVGYSINDKIVIFDRIREVRGKSPLVTPQMVNLSVNQVLSRTLLTGTTTILVLMILYVAGGEAIHGFAFALLVGVLVGTYTSIFIGTPVLLWMMKPAQQRKASDEPRTPKALPQGTR